MSEHEWQVNQSAEEGSDIDAMVGVVQGDAYFGLSRTPTPEDLLETGKRYLDSSVVDTARTLIDDAIGQGLRGGEVCFYFVLALLSGRNLDQLNGLEHQRLSNAKQELLLAGPASSADSAALLVLDLVNRGTAKKNDTAELFDQLDELNPQWRRPILRHLEFVLGGKDKDELWRRSTKQAKRAQTEGRRKDRAWKFFEPDPEPPRPAVVNRPDTNQRTWAYLAGSLALFITLLIVLADPGRQDRPGRTYALLTVGVVGATAGIYFLADWLSWRRVRRQPALAGAPELVPNPDSHFSQTLRYYCRKYSAEKPDPAGWFTEVELLREYVAQELTVTYPELTRFTATPFRWLVRHRARQIQVYGNRGNPDTAPPRPPSLELALISALVTVVAGPVLIADALRAAPLQTLLLAPLLVLTGRLAFPLALRITMRERSYHHAKDRSERELRLAEQAFVEWQERLRDRPCEAEMAAWLDADRTLLIDKALQHYGLDPQKVVSHAILESPGKARPGGRARARVMDGPWRYRVYHLVMFLLSSDGIRQVTSGLDFTAAVLNDGSRENFRYDAICSFRVDPTSNNGRILKLCRLDGNSDQYTIVPDTQSLNTTDDPDRVADISADAAGLNQTMHLLEGVAADGKTWINKSRERTSGRREKTGSPDGPRPERIPTS